MRTTIAGEGRVMLTLGHGQEAQSESAQESVSAGVSARNLQASEA